MRRKNLFPLFSLWGSHLLNSNWPENSLDFTHFLSNKKYRRKIKTVLDCWASHPLAQLSRDPPTPFDRLRHCYRHVYTHISTFTLAVGAPEDVYIRVVSIHIPVCIEMRNQWQLYCGDRLCFTFHSSASYSRIGIIPIGCYSFFFSSHHRHCCQCLTSAQVFFFLSPRARGTSFRCTFINFFKLILIFSLLFPAMKNDNWSNCRLLPSV